MGKIQTEYVGSFTIEGYNDKPKPCPTEGCKGMVYPTSNANIGKCDECEKSVPWSRYQK